MSLSKVKYQHGMTVFQKHWLSDPKLKYWVQEVPNDKYSARCSLCPGAVISVSSMGRQALTSHMGGMKHKERAKATKNSLGIGVFLMSPSDLPSTSTVGLVSKPSSCDTSASEEFHCRTEPQENQEKSEKFESSRGLKKFVLGANVTKAEVLWCLQCVASHKSMRTAGNDISVLKLMFPDSEIVSKLQLQRTKIGYTILFGLAPFFRKELESVLLNCPYFVIGFDESLNKVSQRQQMDINVRYWDSEKDEVSTRYYSSAFLGSCKASDLLQSLLDTLPPLDFRKVLQLSMDGPSVNHKLLNDFKAFVKQDSEENPVILDLGSCGLHTLHNAFKVGMLASGWNVVTFLRALYNVFKDVPARRALYTSCTKSERFPLKFCPVRWLANADVAQRAIDMLPHLRTFVSEVEKMKTKPMSASFLTVAQSIKDPLIGPKLAFFKTVACEIEPFLQEFQSDWPLAPFLYSALNSVVRIVMERFVKPELVAATVNVDNVENLLSFKTIEIGFATKQEMKKCKGLKDLQVLEFRSDCRKVLQKFVVKVMEKSPLKYKLTKNISCLDPSVAMKRDAAQIYLSNLLEILVGKNWLDGTTADKAANEYSKICTSASEQLKTFNRQKDRLDNFWMQLLNNASGRCEGMKKVIQLVLILSHGNANVERGFSVNADCLVENMREETLIAHRQIFDAIVAVGGVENIDITKNMIHSARNASSRYKEALEEKKKTENLKEDEETKRKMNITAIKELQAKKSKLMTEALKESELIDSEIKALSNN